VHGYLQYKAPVYLVDCCTPVSDISSRRHLQSATRHHLTVPRYRLSTFSRRAFSVTGPTVWNSLPNSLRDPALSCNSFRQSLKMNLFRRYHSTTHTGGQLSPSVRPHNPATGFRPPSATVVSTESFSRETGTLRCLQKEMATYRH